MKVFTIILGVVLAAAGVFCLFTPGITLLSIGWVLGILFIIAAVGLIADWAVLHKIGAMSGFDLFLAILTGAVGILLLINQPLRLLTDTLAIYMLGAWMLVSGVVRCYEAFLARKVPGSGWGLLLALGLLMVVLGVYSFFHPMVSAFTLAWLIGFYILLAGFDLILFGAMLHKVKEPDGSADWTVSSDQHVL